MSAANEHFSSLPEVVQPRSARTCRSGRTSGKEVVAGDGKEVWLWDEQKQVTSGDGKEVWPRDEQTVYVCTPDEYLDLSEGGFGELSRTTKSAKKREWYRRLLIWGGALSLLVVLGIALGIGLGLGLQNHDKSNASVPQPSKTTTTFSQKGAFELTGLAACGGGQNINPVWPGQVASNDSSVLVFFQHYTGELRWMLNASPGKWLGGGASDVIATDAKNNTPISVRCAQPGSSTGASLFYVNKDNLVRQRVINNLTYTWADGPFNDLNVQAFQSPSIGLRAAFYAGPIYGVDLTGTDPFTGVRLWVATANTTFTQYSWRPGITQWQQDQTWEGMNGAATPAAFGWFTEIFYVIFMDENNTARLYWIDTSQTKRSTDTHPINVWTETPGFSIPNLDQAAGLNYRNNLYARITSSTSINGWNITNDAENSTVVSTTLADVGGPPIISNSRITEASIGLEDGDTAVWIFYQPTGDSITMSTGLQSTGVWNSTTVPIPDT